MHVDSLPDSGLRPAETAGPAGSQRLFAAYDIPAFALFALLCAISILWWRRPDLLSHGHNPALSTAISAAALVIALGAAYFALGEFLLYGDLSSLYIGLAFVMFGCSDLGFGLIPLAGAWQGRAGVVGYGWGVERIAGGILLVAASMLAQHGAGVFRRRRLVLNGLLLVCVFAGVLTGWAYAAQDSVVSADTQRAMQAAAGGLFFAASFLFWRVTRVERRTWFAWLAFSLTIAAFAQVQYALHVYVLGTVQPGDVFRMVFVSGILLALVAQWTGDYRRLRWQARELEALQVLMTMPSVQDVSAVVTHIVDVVSDSLQASARVLVADRDQRVMRDPFSAQMMQLDMVDGETEDPGRVVVGFEDGPQGHVALGVPLTTANRRLGMLVVVRPAGDVFSSHDMRMLRALGAQASVLLERSLLYEEVAAGAVVEERARLAREIHDGLAQHLAFLKMRVAWLQRSADGVEPKQLKDIEGVLETALIEARHAITTLRSEDQATSTPEAVQNYSEEFGQVAGLDVSISLQDDVPDVGPKARVEVLRIVQESLNNVRKHAHAAHVDVEIAAQDEGLLVTIRDDGSGFEMERTLEGHFGLQIMSERAASVGGRFELWSAPGQGTRVRIWAPRRETESPTGESAWLRVMER